MDKETAIKLFEEQKVRVEWDENQEKWYFSIVDVVAVLTSSEYQTARNYWKVLKHRLSEEGNQTVTNCNQLNYILLYHVGNPLIPAKVLQRYEV